MQITIDAEKCIGCGTCSAMCPEVFKMDDASMKAVVLKKEGGEKCNIEEVAQACAVEAILVTGNQ
ncbi:ferredoxin [bacterium (Candidatus Torokbacteria) CG09_land_8_20_14_0_10_42_11]|nr:MAG: ferredoxin [bacterium (Candidatus Torokbacteria) CG09_land_8_20_14_0_10_42_11]